jgi:hypothetical protein
LSERKDIDERLCNWARWNMANAGRGADCMTGAICEGMRKAALGNVWAGHEVRDPIDDADAVRIEVGLRKVPFRERLLLTWHYIEKAPPGVIARKLSFRPREFDELLLAAQEAIEDVVDSGNR